MKIRTPETEFTTKELTERVVNLESQVAVKDIQILALTELLKTKGVFSQDELDLIQKGILGRFVEVSKQEGTDPEPFFIFANETLGLN
ncbi:hypothetical protein NYE70_25825 [Paenibacillus sp. FSL R5-0407]|uniref:hypothetical protein n=1 Tax=Paenibacillus sp. FSL R5-0407 TaxID=2975320 RepID=UPI0030F9D4E6